MRIAVFDTELAARGPGLMLRDIRRNSPSARSAAELLATVGPDIVLILGVDFDHELHGLSAFSDLLAENGHTLIARYARPPNRGLASGVDLNGDGISHGPEDSHGFGRFYGQGSMAILSRWPVRETDVRDFSGLLWRDLPGAQMPFIDGKPYPSAEAHAVQRLSSGGHWIVPVETPYGPISLLTLDATPPVFDGPEDRNGLRNADEIRLWNKVLNGDLGGIDTPDFVLLGNANLDPERGAGRRQAITALLNNPRLQDPRPKGPDGRTVTADWPEPTPGDLRVDYILPSADLRVLGSGILWPQGEGASRHALVWVDIEM